MGKHDEALPRIATVRSASQQGDYESRLREDMWLPNLTESIQSTSRESWSGVTRYSRAHGGLLDVSHVSDFAARCHAATEPGFDRTL